jgi:multiple sugar transport system permease protein
MTTVLTRPPVAENAHRARQRTAKGNRLLSWIGTHAIAVALALAFTGPLLFVVLTSVMTEQQALTSELWPRHWQWGNYAAVFRRAPMLTWFANTLLYATALTVLSVGTSLPVAYALARFRFRGRNAAFLLVIAMMMLPPQVLVIPMYIVWAQAHLTGTLWPLIVPAVCGDAFSIFLLRQFLLTIPKEYSDAAKVDGCNEFAVLWRVVLPMARPAIAATGMFMFFFAWNDYFGPLLYASENPDSWPLSLALASFRSQYQVEWNVTMAATLLVMLPVMVVFFLAQKAFVEGVTLTGVKG